jgi:FkbM family methyltransferase
MRENVQARARKLRPAKVRRAVRRRRFEYELSRLPLTSVDGMVELGSAYGGWTVPGSMIERLWLCYSVGAGGDISFDRELMQRFGVMVRAFDAVAQFAESALQEARDAGQEARFSAHHAAIAMCDGPIRMQQSHDPHSRSVSSAGLYESDRFIELPGRTLTSLMTELGDDHIDLLKLDIEGAEYEVIPTLDLRALGVKVFATQLHHSGSVREARALVTQLRQDGYELVACRPIVKLTFARRDLLA